MPCRTNEGDTWRSFVPPGNFEGHFAIGKVEPSGAFRGVFCVDDTHHEPIEGQCDRDMISFVRPADRPRFQYEGEFVTDDLIRGIRRRVFEAVQAPLVEEWEAVKVTGVQCP